MNGIINVYKEAGFTSFDVVAKLRGMLKTKKIGHTGTLDPDAVGVLPICVGNATKVCELLMDETKEYIALMHLGLTTDTQDMSGRILDDRRQQAALLSDKDIEAAIMSFVGEIEQIPPMYSALKVNGQKLYDLARKGIEVERKARKVRIEEIEILEWIEDETDLFVDVGLADGGTADAGNVISVDNSVADVGGIASDCNTDSSDCSLKGKNDLHNLNYVNKERLIRFRVVCSKGTYIRTLCHDIGQKLGCGAAMEHLERSRVGAFTKENAITLGQLQDIIDSVKDGWESVDTDKNASGLHNVLIAHNLLIPVDIIFAKYPALHVNERGIKALSNGNQLQTDMIDEVNNNLVMLTARQVYRMYSYDNQFAALYEYHSGWKVLKNVKMFL